MERSAVSVPNVQEEEDGSDSCDEDLPDVIIGNLVEENEEEEELIDLMQEKSTSRFC